MKRLVIALLATGIFLSIFFVNLSYVFKKFNDSTSEFEQAVVNCKLIYDDEAASVSWKRGTLTCTISEDSSLIVENLSNVSVYCRIIVFPCVQSADSSGVATLNVDGGYTVGKEDLSINPREDSDWIKNGNIYYYKKIIPEKEKSGDLIKESTLTLPTGIQKVSVKAIPEVIQANPSNAVEEAWTKIEVDSSNKELKLKTL